MIKKLSFAFVFAALTFAAPALSEAAEDLSSYNAMYRSEQYEEAYRGYAAALAKDRRNPGLWYNAGNALFRLNRLGDAVYAYSNAFMLSPRNSDIRFNLEYAMRLTGQTFVPEGTPKALYLLFYLLSEYELKALLILLFWLGMSAAILAICLKGKARSYAKNAAIAVAAAFVLCGGWAWARSYAQFSTDAAVVTSGGGIKLLSGPGENFRECAAAPEGRIVRILSSSDDNYYEIGLDAEGISGWALKSGVKRI